MLLSIPAPWQNKLKIGRIVQIAPREKSVRWQSLLQRFSLTRWICGPMLEELSDEGLAKFPQLPQKFECGKIYVTKNNEKNMSTQKHIISIRNIIGSPLKNRNVVNAAINFIYKGEF